MILYVTDFDTKGDLLYREQSLLQTICNQLWIILCPNGIMLPIGVYDFIVLKCSIIPNERIINVRSNFVVNR